MNSNRISAAAAMAALAAGLGSALADEDREPTKEDMESVEKEMLGYLWGMATTNDKTGLQDLGAPSRLKTIELLRAAADTLENNPQNIKGLVFICGGNTAEKPDEVASSCLISGSPPAIAAAFVQMQATGSAALKKVEGELLLRALIGRATDQ
jgi:hypothetical protein